MNGNEKPWSLGINSHTGTSAKGYDTKKTDTFTTDEKR